METRTPSDQSENARRGFCDSVRIRRDISGSHPPRLSIRSRTVERLLVDGPQYGARLERKRTVHAYGGRWKGGGGAKGTVQDEEEEEEDEGGAKKKSRCTN